MSEMIPGINDLLLGDIYTTRREISKDGQRLTGSDPYSFNPAVPIHHAYAVQLLMDSEADVVMLWGRNVEAWFAENFGAINEDGMMIGGRIREILYADHPEYIKRNADPERILRNKAAIQKFCESSEVEFNGEWFDRLIERRKDRRPANASQDVSPIFHTAKTLVDKARAALGRRKEKKICPVVTCGKGPYSASGLQYHTLAAHPPNGIPVKRYKCPFVGCDKGWIQSNVLTAHLRSNHLPVGEERQPSFICTVLGCDKKYLSYEGLRQHTKNIHEIGDDESKYPYICTAVGCTKKYKNRKGLNSHERSIHGIDDMGTKEVWACTVVGCGKEYSSPSGLAVHSRSVHPADGEDPRPFKCTVDGCNKAYKQKCHLKVHQRSCPRSEAETEAMNKRRGEKTKAGHAAARAARNAAIKAAKAVQNIL